MDNNLVHFASYLSSHIVTPDFLVYIDWLCVCRVFWSGRYCRRIWSLLMQQTDVRKLQPLLVVLSTDRVLGNFNENCLHNVWICTWCKYPLLFLRMFCGIQQSVINAFSDRLWHVHITYWYVYWRLKSSDAGKWCWI